MAPVALACTHSAPAPTLADAPTEAVPRRGQIPTGIESAADDTTRVFECLNYNHISLLNETDRRDRDAVRGRVEGLQAAHSLCFSLVAQTFGKHPTFTTAFEKEWEFSEEYFGLTLEAFEVQNKVDFCRKLKSTTESAQQANEAVRTYSRWMTDKRVTQHKEAAIQDLAGAARQKVSAFGIIVSRLGQQYKRECLP